MRFGHFDKELTKQYRKEGKFVSRDSMVLVRKDGSLRIELHGDDASNLRFACFTRDRWKCVGGSMGENHCHGHLEMSHDPAMSKSEGSDVLSQVFTRCWRHHVLFDKKGQPAHF